jgi:hypothetical protein
VISVPVATPTNVAMPLASTIDFRHPAINFISNILLNINALKRNAKKRKEFQVGSELSITMHSAALYAPNYD